MRLASPHTTGRLIQPSEGRARGDAPVLVLTYEYWLARFGGDPSVAGRAVRVDPIVALRAE